MAQDGDRDERDDGQRQDVGEREERGEDASRHLLRVLVADAVRDAVRPQDRHVHAQHQHPDARHLPAGTIHRVTHSTDTHTRPRV